METRLSDNLPEICAVVVTFNGKKHLEVCLPTLLKMNYPKNKYTIIVVDNASINDTVDFVKKNYPQITLVESKKNLGWAAATDMGIIWAQEHTKSQYYFLFNDDTKIDADFFNQTLNFAQKNPEYGIFGGKVYNMGTNVIQMAGGGMFKPHSFEFTLLGEQQKDVGQFNNSMEIDHVFEAACCVSKTTIDKIGLFDPNYFYVLEGPDFCLRAKRQGIKSAYVAQAKAEHYLSSTTSQKKNVGGLSKIFFSRLRFIKSKNRLRLSIKNYSIKETILIELSYFISGVKRLKQFPNLVPFISFFVGFIYSMLWNLIYLPQTLQYRYSNKENYEPYLKKYF